ncbi:MAG: methionine adenosyltransferase [Clostridia bacterium]|nr:methionine adenosyltransferase [Clostridia bacterium]
MKKYRLFSSESVTEGHPDKVCDLISDSILDLALAGDPKSRVAVETCASTGYVMVFGEITTTADIDVENAVRNALRSIGYKKESGIDPDNCEIIVRLDKQSPDIAGGVTSSLEEREGEADAYDRLGAGDQGMMFGYASNETEEHMPLPIYLAHKLSARLTEVRKQGVLPYLRPDGKVQVTVAYDGDKPHHVDTVVISSQHEEDVTLEQIQTDLKSEVALKVISADLLTEDTKFLINPSGRFVIGGPEGDSGLTGRKIIVDTYGGVTPHGGGAFSGKDPTKVDRSASYYARYVCKNIVASGLADKLELQVAYAIGKARPVSVCINSFGTGKVSDERLLEIIEKVFDFRPQSIIKTLGLNRPIYTQSTNYGHFGKPNLPWEMTDKVDEIKKAI